MFEIKLKSRIADKNFSQKIHLIALVNATYSNLILMQHTKMQQQIIRRKAHNKGRNKCKVITNT